MSLSLFISFALKLVLNSTGHQLYAQFPQSYNIHQSLSMLLLRDVNVKYANCYDVVTALYAKTIN